MCFESVVFTFELFYILDVIADDLSDIRSNKNEAELEYTKELLYFINVFFCFTLEQAI